VTVSEKGRNEATRCRGRLSRKVAIRRIRIIRHADSALLFKELGAVSEELLSKEMSQNLKISFK